MEAIRVMGFWSWVYARFFYRGVMRVAHRFHWHYAPPSYPDGDTMLWCHWCGFRSVTKRAFSKGRNTMPSDTFVLGLGDKVQDRVSGLTGLVTSRAEHLFGCARYWISPQELKDGKPVEGLWLDEDSLELVERSVITPRQYRVVKAEEVAARPAHLPGGPTSQPSSQSRQTTK